MENSIKYNCVFGGGGIRGMCYIGAISALKELDIQINSLAGSSVGAVFASLFAAGYDELQIKDLFLDFNFNMFRDLNINFFDNDLSISKGEIFLDWLRDKISSKVWGQNSSARKSVTFSDLKTDLHILTLDLNTNMPYIFSKKTTPDVDIAFAVRCSAGLPGLMKPVSYNGMLLVDGDLIKSWPASKIYHDLDNPDSRILEFRLEGSRDGSDLKNPIDYLSSVINVVWYLSTENVFSQYSLNDRYDFIIIDTKDLILFDFTLDNQTKSNLIDIGYNKTKEFFLLNLPQKKHKLLSDYINVLNLLSAFEKQIYKYNIKDAIFILNEIICFIYTQKFYIDASFFEQFANLKSLFLNSVKKHFIFAYKINNETIVKDKIIFIKNMLNERINEINNYISKYENIS